MKKHNPRKKKKPAAPKAKQPRIRKLDQEQLNRMHELPWPVTRFPFFHDEILY
jgi:hypothetical protein